MAPLSVVEMCDCTATSAKVFGRYLRASAIDKIVGVGGDWAGMESYPLRGARASRGRRSDSLETSRGGERAPAGSREPVARSHESLPKWLTTPGYRLTSYSWGSQSTSRYRWQRDRVRHEKESAGPALSRESKPRAVPQVLRSDTRHFTPLLPSGS